MINCRPSLTNYECLFFLKPICVIGMACNLGK